jgi:hypothetical protein
MAFYIKSGFYSGYDVLVFTGANTDAINAFVGSGNLAHKNGTLYAYGERIEIGDAVRKTNPGAAAAAKVRAFRIEADTYRVEAIAYSGSNLDDIIAFCGPALVEFRDDVLYVSGQAVAEDDYVTRTSRVVLGKVGKLTFEAAYTAE